MNRAIVLSHRQIAHELGVLGDWLTGSGFSVQRAAREDEPPLEAADLLVVLGSPGSVATGHCPPAGDREIAQVRDWIRARRPYLGICYGSQVLARATGGHVARMPQTYRGWTSLADDATDAAFAGPWMLWHDDAVTAPADATVFARTAHADVAFGVDRAWGMQFHPELDSASLERMAVALGAAPAQYEPIVTAMRADEAGHRDRAVALFDAFAEATGSTSEGKG